MKKFLASILCCVMVLSSSMALCSCNDSSSAKRSDGAYLVHTDPKDYYDTNNVILEFAVVNKNTSYDKATLVIDTKGLFSIDGLKDDDGVYRLSYDDFGNEKYAEGVNETLSLRFNGVSDSYDFLRGSINILLETEEEDKSYNIFFVTDGESLAFLPRGSTDSYYKLCLKFPKADFSSKISEDPLYDNPYSTCELEMGATVEAIAVTLPSAKRQRVSDTVSLDVAIGQSIPFFEDAAVIIEAEGFSIQTSNDTSLNTLTREYSSFDSKEYLFVRGCDAFENYIIHYDNEIAYHESISLTYNKKGASEGMIKFTLRSKNGNLRDGTKLNDSEEVKIYYSTNGRRIAYSVVSADAAKRELYGDFGYFWNVSVPEFFDDLFDGCD